MSVENLMLGVRRLLAGARSLSSASCRGVSNSIGLVIGMSVLASTGNASSSASASPQPLINGGSVPGTISVAGEVDCYSFVASAGDNVVLSVVDFNLTNFHPRMTVDSPGGTLLLQRDGAGVALGGFTAPVSGVYTLNVFDISQFGTATGDYLVHYVRVPDANEHGALTNGGSVIGDISIGDLDTHTFDAAVGDYVFLSVVDTVSTGLEPDVTIYDPTGTPVVTDDMHRVVQLDFTTTMAGTYTVLIHDVSFFGIGTGAYEIHLARIPDANEFGILSSGVPVIGDIRIGDVDTFTFPAAAGATLDIRLEDTSGSNLYPRVTLFDPAGVALVTDRDPILALLSTIAPLTGTYTVLVHDSSQVPGVGPSGMGSYTLLMEGGAGEAYCFGDGAGAMCPCGATGLVGEGCANTSGLGGAALSAMGTPSLTNDSFTLQVTGVPGAKPGLILRGSNQLNGGLGNPVGDGLLCTGGNTARSQVQVTVSGGTLFTSFQGAGFGASSNGVGVNTNYQFWYRDAQNTCSGSGFNFTNAWTVVWLP